MLPKAVQPTLHFYTPLYVRDWPSCLLPGSDTVCQYGRLQALTTATIFARCAASLEVGAKRTHCLKQGATVHNRLQIQPTTSF